MFVIGLTGGSGAGKGYVSESFKSFGVPSLDTDIVSRAVCRPGTPCIAELVGCFGTAILLPDGSLDRKKLGGIVFSDDEKRMLLNRVTHRYILAECKSWLSEREGEGYYAAIIDAPLLFESRFDAYCDFTVGVLARREKRLARIMRRDGITEDAATRRLDCQPDDSFYLKRCDYIIINNGTERVELQADLVYQQIRWL